MFFLLFLLFWKTFHWEADELAARLTQCWSSRSFAREQFFNILIRKTNILIRKTDISIRKTNNLIRKPYILIRKTYILVRKTNILIRKTNSNLQMALSTPQSSGFPMESLPEKQKKQPKMQEMFVKTMNLAICLSFWTKYFLKKSRTNRKKKNYLLVKHSTLAFLWFLAATCTSQGRLAQKR